MYLGFVLLAIATFLVGVSIGFYLSPSSQAGSLTGSILQYASVAGTAILVIRFVTDYLRQNVFEYGGIYKKQELREVVGRKEHGWGNEVKERRTETGYYLRIKKKRGQGRLENCEGQIIIQDIDGSEANVTTVWEGFGYPRYRNISIQDGLKLSYIRRRDKNIDVQSL